MLREHLSCVRGNCALNDYMLREQLHRAWDNCDYMSCTYIIKAWLNELIL